MNRNISPSILQDWKVKVLAIVDNRIELGKRKFRKTWSVRIEGKVKEELERLKEKYVLTVTDKAQNNVLFTCKNFYIDTVRQELTRPGQSTYHQVDKDAATINNEVVDFSASKNIRVLEEMNEVPPIYLIPKMNKTPKGSRFIAGSKICSIKPLSKHFSKALNLFFLI